MKKSDLKEITYRRLLSLAAAAGIAGRSHMRKAQLVAALAKHRTPRPSRIPFQESSELPASYGRTRLTLMEVDPHRVHAFWEVTPAARRAAMRRLGAGKTPVRWVLRLHDVSQPGSRGTGLVRHFDVAVDLAPGNWYVAIPENDRHYRAELGATTDAGSFAAACRSNTVHIPRSQCSARYNPQWLEVRGGPGTIRQVPEPAPHKEQSAHDAAAVQLRPGRAARSRTAADTESKFPAAAPPERTSPAEEPHMTQERPQDTGAAYQFGWPCRPPDAIENISSFSMGGRRHTAQDDQIAGTDLRRSK